MDVPALLAADNCFRPVPSPALRLAIAPLIILLLLLYYIIRLYTLTNARDKHPRSTISIGIDIKSILINPIQHSEKWEKNVNPHPLPQLLYRTRTDSRQEFSAPTESILMPSLAGSAPTAAKTLPTTSRAGCGRAPSALGDC